MGVRNASAATTTLIATNLPTSTDTIVLTTGAIGLVQDSAQVLIFWYVLVVTAAAATALTIRLRRGAAITSTQINALGAVSAVASNNIALSGCYSDLPGIVAGLQYSVTMTHSGGAGAGTVLDGSLIAMVL